MDWIQRLEIRTGFLMKIRIGVFLLDGTGQHTRKMDNYGKTHCDSQYFTKNMEKYVEIVYNNTKVLEKIQTRHVWKKQNIVISMVDSKRGEEM